MTVTQPQPADLWALGLSVFALSFVSVALAWVVSLH